MSGTSGSQRDLIVHRQLCHFFGADVKPGPAIAKDLGGNVDAIMEEMNHKPVGV